MSASPSSPRLYSFFPILLAAYLLVSGNGIVAVLLPYRGHLVGMSETVIAWFGTGYFAGMLSGAFVVPWLIRHFGSKRAFIFCAALGAFACFYLPYDVAPIPWFICRSLIGLSLAALYSALEPWLSAAAAGHARALLLAMGSTVQYAAWTTGSQIFAQSEPTSPWLFVIAGSLMAAATIPLFLNRVPEPPRPVQAHLALGWFYRTAPIAFFGALLIGAANGAFWSLNPVYGAQIHLNATQIGNLVTAMTVGSAVAQVPFGHLSDKINRRFVIFGLGIGAAACNMALAQFGSALPISWLYGLVFATSFLMMPAYYVVSAHAVDLCGRENAVMAGAAILFLYCIAAMIGPQAASALSSALGPGALYVWTGTMYLLLGLVAGGFWLRRNARQKG